MSALRVDANELEPDGSSLLHDGVLFTGIAVESWPNGKPKSETEYADGWRHGVDREWYQSGQLAREAEYWRGGANGREREWYESGQLASDATYELSVLVSRRRYDPSGRVTEEFQLGPDDPNFEILRLKRLAIAPSD